MDEKQIQKLVENSGAEMTETHISWILLDDYAYKIKKPVKFSFLDFTTLEKRKHFCEEEVRLNRRLSPGMYLGVAGITNGEEISLEGSGNPLDYAVKMKRMPKNRTMDMLLAQDEITKQHIEEIAGIVAKFHKNIQVISGKKYGSPEVVKSQIDDLAGFRSVVQQSAGLGTRVDFIVEKSDEFIRERKGSFEKRQREGHIRDCHGDLHSANIFITDKISIFDCIEFNPEFRYIDTASEIAFMSMDLDAFGKGDFSEFFVRRYLDITKDEGMREMLGLYKCYRANVRAKIAAIDYTQHPGPEPRERMEKYLGLAEEYAEKL
ncbi:hypothetical protein GF318_02400 [Candidatus Micrarchaeota archaeon]|nr:hypothetical protein [Candidatus Micrarchaeota archaeon]